MTFARPRRRGDGVAGDAVLADRLPRRQLHRRRQLRERIDLVRQRHGVDEELLEVRLQRSLDLLDPAHLLLDLAAMVAVEQRHQRAGAGGVADGLHLGEIAIGDQAEHHRVFRIDEGAEGAGEADRVDLGRRPASPSAA